MRGRKRRYHRYELKQNRRVVYRGITEDPDRRATEHKQQGKRFTRMIIVGPAVSKESAEKWEEESLESYRRNHCGKNPKYNEKEE